MINPDITAIIAREEQAMIAFRRDLHAHPELPWEEKRTTDRVAAGRIPPESSPTSPASSRVKPWLCAPIWMRYRWWS